LGRRTGLREGSLRLTAGGYDADVAPFRNHRHHHRQQEKKRYNVKCTSSVVASKGKRLTRSQSCSFGSLPQLPGSIKGFHLEGPWNSRSSAFPGPFAASQCVPIQLMRCRHHEARSRVRHEHRIGIMNLLESRIRQRIVQLVCLSGLRCTRVLFKLSQRVLFELHLLDGHHHDVVL